MQGTVYRTAVEHGWWEHPSCKEKASPDAEPKDVDFHLVASKIALMHSELSEALEAVRDGKFRIYLADGSMKPEGMVVEFADVVIRMMDLCEDMGLDLEDAVRQKAAFNAGRPFKHGGKAI